VPQGSDRQRKSLLSDFKDFSPQKSQAKYSSDIFSNVSKATSASHQNPKSDRMMQHTVKNRKLAGDLDLPAAVHEVRNIRWTENELSALKTGIQLYGTEYDSIKSHFKSELKNRTVDALGIKASRLMKEGDLRKKRNVLWTEEELSALKTGIQLYGTEYDSIKSHFQSEFKNRSVDALDNKARALMKKGDLDITVRKVRENVWTEEELSALKTGVQLYGFKYDVIKSHFQSEFKNRTINALGKKARALMKKGDIDMPATVR
jgi:D-mannonate dehydratase